MLGTVLGERNSDINSTQSAHSYSCRRDRHDHSTYADGALYMPGPVLMLQTEC